MLFRAIEMKVGGAGNHGCIIRTIVNRWIAQADSEWRQLLLQAGAQASIGGYTARQDYLLYMILLGSKASFHGQHVNDSFLKAGGEPGNIRRAFLRGLRSHLGIATHLFAFYGASGT